MSQFECSVKDLTHKNEPLIKEENAPAVIQETKKETVEANSKEINDINVSLLDKIKDVKNIKTILFIIIGYIITTSSLFVEIFGIWLPNFTEDGQISLMAKVIIAGLIGLSVILFASSS